MRLYIDTWSQVRPIHGWFNTNNNLELQLIALSLLSDNGSSYVALNSELKTSKILNSDIYDKVKAWRKSPILYHQHRLAQICSAFCEYVTANSQTADEPIMVIGYKMNFTKILLDHILTFKLHMPPDALRKRITYFDLYDGIQSLAARLPDEEFTSLVSPYSIMIEQKENLNFSLEEKVRMLESHEDFPDIPQLDLLASAHAMKYLSSFIKNKLIGLSLKLSMLHDEE